MLVLKSRTSQNVVILAACRTAIAKFGRSFVGVNPTRLGSVVVSESIAKTGMKPKNVEKVIMGNAIQAGLGPNPARQASIYAGLPIATEAVTVNESFASGLESVVMGMQAIRSGDADIVVAGGMESMSGAPYLERYARWGAKFGDVRGQDGMIIDGLWDPSGNYHFGILGEHIARKFGVTRQKADEFAFESNMKAASTQKEGGFDREVVKVQIEREMGDVLSYEKDECIRPNTTLEALSKLKPVFKPGGILTAGNSSQLADGAAVLVLASETKAASLGVKPLARVLSHDFAGTRWENAMEAPIRAVESLLSQTGLSVDSIDLYECDEMYSTASVALRDKIGIPKERFNIHGGSIALGDPIGCSGARILTTLVHSLTLSNKKTGLAASAGAGGNAVAILVETTS